MRTILTSVFVALMGSILLFVILPMSSERQEEATCVKLQAQSEQYRNDGFFLTGWQKDMCDHWGIIIDAPVQR